MPGVKNNGEAIAWLLVEAKGVTLGDVGEAVSSCIPERPKAFEDGICMNVCEFATST